MEKADDRGGEKENLKGSEKTVGQVQGGEKVVLSILCPLAFGARDRRSVKEAQFYRYSLDMKWTSESEISDIHAIMRICFQ